VPQFGSEDGNVCKFDTYPSCKCCVLKDYEQFFTAYCNNNNTIVIAVWCAVILLCILEVPGSNPSLECLHFGKTPNLYVK
jgi:hypothetical protein